MTNYLSYRNLGFWGIGKSAHLSQNTNSQIRCSVNKAGLPDIRFHDLRHTVTTMHLSMMTNPKIVQELLGHSTISITMDAYSHVLPPMHREAMGNINEWLIAHTEAQKKDQVQRKEAEAESQLPH